MAETLSIYMAGSCAQLIDDLREPYAHVALGVELMPSRVAMTGAIAAEVLAGAPADVVLSANRAYADQLHAAGLMPEGQAVLRRHDFLPLEPTGSQS